MLKPTDVMTRGDFFIELLTVWEEALKIHEASPPTPKNIALARETRAAINLLKDTYPVTELVDLELFDKF